MFSFITEKNVFKKWQASKEYTDKLTDRFPEFERVKRNLPIEGIDDNYPKTTDGTTASIVKKTPRRVIQQLPTGTVENTDGPEWLSIIAEAIYVDRILPMSNEEYDLIQKCWTLIENGLSFGSTCIYSPFVEHEDGFSPDMTIPYWGDVFLQPGKKSGYSCKYVFIRGWYQEEDIDEIIESQEGNDETTWDVEALKEIKTKITGKDDKAITPHEKDSNDDNEAIELVTAFQVGYKAKFFTFHPESKKLVRTKVNNDPRGKMPIDWFYADTDGSNPLGRGIIELVIGIQNLIDSDMQMYQFNRALMLAPPIIKRGQFSKSKIRYSPNAIIDLGTDTQASIETLKVDTSAIANYPDLYGLQKSQLQNLINSNGDTTISAEVGNPGFSKTSAGVKQQQEIISIDDNFIRKMFETAFANWSETAINLYFAERVGTEVLQLSDKYAEKLRKLASEGKFDITLLSDDNKLLINYDDVTPALKFRVDSSSSREKTDSQQVEAIDNMFESINSNPILTQYFAEHPEKAIELFNARVKAIGIADPEKITINIDEFKAEQEQKQNLMAQQQAEMTPQPSQLPQENAEIAPEMETTEQPQPERDMELVNAFKALGIDDETADEAIDLLHKGYSNEQILTALELN